ncbi:MAG: lysoplasmalogenase [Clostridia bacterium]|nr:lysoplasmalogenase [Clostridia bacterium]
MPSLIFLILYLIAAAFNLYAAAKHNDKISRATKPALLLLLCLYCLFSGLPAPDLLIIAAFFACWLGDVLLMFSGDVWFFAGGVSFFAGHVLLILLFARFAGFGAVPFSITVPAAAAYLCVSASVMTRSFKKAPRIMLVPLCLYLACNSVMNVFALTRLISAPGLWSALSYAGAVLFFLSDCVLFLIRYDDRPGFYKTDFCVMLTYICGVFLIATGLVPVTL